MQRGLSDRARTLVLLQTLHAAQHNRLVTISVARQHLILYLSFSEAFALSAQLALVAGAWQFLRRAGLARQRSSCGNSLRRAPRATA